MIEPIINVLKAWNELKQAKSLLDTFAKRAVSYQEYDILAHCYCEIKDYLSSITFAQKALTVAPSNEAMYATRSNLAKVYNHANYPDKALDYILVNERLNPGDFEMLLEKAFTLFLLNRKDESKHILEHMATLDGLDPKVIDRVRFNLATHKMYNGKYKEGLYDFVNSGTTLDLWQSTSLPLKKWDGISRPGDTLIIYAKGGIGDEVINFRFCEDVKARGMEPLWLTDRQDLKIIFTRHGTKCINSLAQAPTQNTWWIHAMSLPVALDLEPNQFNHGTYLSVDDAYDAKWKRIINSPKRKVGLRWAGNMEYDHDLHRGLPIVDLYCRIKEDTDEYYSLQRDDGAEKTCSLENVIDLQYQLETLEDTLAALNQLDVFITSCTSLAHISAALGKRTIVLVPITAYYVWIGEHWYGDNVTVLYQTECRDWSAPIAQLVKLLKEKSINFS